MVRLHSSPVLKPSRGLVVEAAAGVKSVLSLYNTKIVCASGDAPLQLEKT